MRASYKCSYENIIFRERPPLSPPNHLICTLAVQARANEQLSECPFARSLATVMLCARMSSQCVAFIAWCSYVIYYLFLWKIHILTRNATQTFTPTTMKSVVNLLKIDNKEEKKKQLKRSRMKKERIEKKYCHKNCYDIVVLSHSQC